MEARLPLHIDRSAWLAYLGVHDGSDQRIKDGLARAEKALIGTAQARATLRPAAFEDLPLEGSSIRKHLAGCHSMIVLGVTIGPAIDRLIRRQQVRDMADALFLDSGASVLVEQVADLYQELVQDRIADHLTQRFSPGYGDFPIEVQTPLVRFIDGPRRIGLTVSSSHILLPRKSITAILGVSDLPRPGHLASCDECLIRDLCIKRKEGRACHA